MAEVTFQIDEMTGQATAYVDPNDGLWHDANTGAPYHPDGDRLMSPDEYQGYINQYGARPQETFTAEQEQAVTEEQVMAAYTEARDEFLSDPRYSGIDPAKFDKFIEEAPEDPNATFEGLAANYQTAQRDPLGSAIDSMWSEVN